MPQPGMDQTQSPPDPAAIAYCLRRGERLIFEVRVSSLDHACDAVDLVTAAVSAVRFAEHSVFVEDLIDRCASTHGVDLTEHFVEIAKQQGRCSLGLGFSPVIIKFGVISVPYARARASLADAHLIELGGQPADGQAGQ